MGRPKNDSVRRIYVLHLIDVEIEEWKAEREDCFRNSDRWCLIGEILKVLRGRRKAIVAMPSAIDSESEN